MDRAAARDGVRQDGLEAGATFTAVSEGEGAPGVLDGLREQPDPQAVRPGPAPGRDPDAVVVMALIWISPDLLTEIPHPVAADG